MSAISSSATLVGERQGYARSARRPLLWATLWSLLAGTAVASLALGRYDVPFDRVIGILISNVVPVDPWWTELEERVVELIRLPRVLVAIFAGSALAITGAALQGIFSNPLVGPQIIGVSSGAAFGGALAILLMPSMVAMVGFAFGWGLVAIVLVYLLSRIAGRGQLLSLVLAGVIVSSFFTALVSAIKYVADPEQHLPAIVYWLMGSLATSTYSKVWTIALPVLLSGLPLLMLRFRINVLSLGDEEAQSLGVKVERTRWTVLVCVAFCTAAVVSVGGVIGWVGLVIPHMARMIVGHDNSFVLPASAFFGATYLLIVDDIARTATPGEIPLGVITGLIGAPVFGYLFWRTQRAAHGWRND